MGVKTYHVGVDLHRNNFTYCVRYSNGEIVDIEKTPNLQKYIDICVELQHPDLPRSQLRQRYLQGDHGLRRPFNDVFCSCKPDDIWLTALPRRDYRMG